MKIGKMRQRVTLQVLGTPTVALTGQKRPNYTEVGTYWAKVAPVSGTESPNADRLKAKTKFEVQMRYVGSIDAVNHRLIYGTRTLAIEAVAKPDEVNREYLLTCIEVVNPT